MMASRCRGRAWAPGGSWGTHGPGTALASDPGLTRGHVGAAYFTAEGASYWAREATRDTAAWVPFTSADLRSF